MSEMQLLVYFWGQGPLFASISDAISKQASRKGSSVVDISIDYIPQPPRSCKLREFRGIYFIKF